MPPTKREPFVPMLPFELNEAIGAFITTWSNAAGLLSMIISNLAAGKTLGPKDDLVFVFAHIGMDVRVQIGLIRSMGAARLDAEGSKTLGKICDGLEKSKEQRDKFAHAPWSMSSGHAVAYTLKTVGKVKISQEGFTVAAVTAESQKLVEWIGDLVELVQKHGYLVDYQLSSGL